ncbi:MAG: hypothetical protein ACOC3V_04490 [bacterium]
MNKKKSGVFDESINTPNNIKIIDMSDFIMSKNDMILIGRTYGEEIKKKIEERERKLIIYLLDKYDKMQLRFDDNIKWMNHSFFTGLLLETIEYINDMETLFSKIIFVSKHFKNEDFKKYYEYTVREARMTEILK